MPALAERSFVLVIFSLEDFEDKEDLEELDM
jgi:hypothetical protein